MMKAKIVLDTSYGDGGKGLTVDNLCRQALASRESVAVVRFSGGQQCGHTVIRDGYKHIFSSYGSGSLQGVPTYYTADTTMYLPFLQNEYLKLTKDGYKPMLMLHPHTRVTTPYDVAYNRALETLRGRDASKHGSCGMGVGATLKRHDETPYRLYVSDFGYLPGFHQKMSGIASYYSKLVHRLSNSNNGGYGDPFMHEYRKHAAEQRDLYEYSVSQLSNIPAFRVNTFKFADNVIYEGSQGIMLDMDHGIFPNVTYGHTTSKNALIDIARLGVRSIEVYYVSRCYLTRHGRGWMPNEEDIELTNTSEEINVTNPWQEDFRTGELDYDLIQYAVNADSGYHPRGVYKNLVLTCLDQRPNFKADLSRLKYFDNIYSNDSPQAGHTSKTTI